MKCKICCIIALLIVCLNVVTGAVLSCKNSETNAEYIIQNTEPAKHLMSKLFYEKIEELQIKFNNVIATQIEEFKLSLEKPIDCRNAMAITQRSGVYEIYPNIVGITASFPVFCRHDNDQYHGDWSVIMRRVNRSFDFDRNWTEYKHGFGDFNGDFFIGLDKLHAMTNSKSKQQLLIIMKTTKNIEQYIRYDAFSIGSETEGYVLKELGKYSGSAEASDGLHYHLNMKFSTKDVDNDEHRGNCAIWFQGAGWFKGCMMCNLFGQYAEMKCETSADDSMAGSNAIVNLHFIEMLIKPID